MDFQYLILMAAVLADTVIGVLVLSRDYRSYTNRFFALFAWLSAVLSVANIVSLHQSTPESTLHYARLSISAATLYCYFLFLTVHTFPSKRIRLKSWQLILATLLSGIVLLLTQTPYVFQSVTGIGEASSPVPGPAIPLFALVNGFYIVSAIYLLVTRHRAATGSLRAQLQYLLLGIATSSVLIFVTDFIFVILLKTTALLSLLPLYTLLFVLATAYAILTHHLFDIRVIIKRTVLYSGLVLFTLTIYSLVLLLMGSFLGGGQTFQLRSFLPNAIAAILIAFGFEPIRKYLNTATDSLFFKSEYEQQAVLRTLSQKLNNVIALDEALEIVMQTIVKNLHLRHAATFVFQPGENGELAIKRIKQIGYASSSKVSLNDTEFVVPFFAENAGVLQTEDLIAQLEKEDDTMRHLAKQGASRRPKEASALIRGHAVKQAVLRRLQAMDVAVTIPLRLGQQPIGVIFLSDKLSGDPFFPDDIVLLGTVGDQAISSIQKAKLYEGDQMKSEFVSIASHELLTPISAIEGYLSMILEENLGHIDGQAREYLSKVYTSAKRLSMLIKDLLSVSRIESGQLRIEAQQLDIAKMINDTADQLRFMAQDKKLVLKVELPEKGLPPVWADPDRTMQILINLVSNAIKYSNSGSVVIAATLVSHPHPHVNVSVSDTGIGMTKQQQAHLFEKFYRVDSPETTGIIGTGLGLYITKSILEIMGGSINLKSAPGKGSTFSFTLPLFKVETSKMPS